MNDDQAQGPGLGGGAEAAGGVGTNARHWVVTSSTAPLLIEDLAGLGGEEDVGIREGLAVGGEDRRGEVRALLQAELERGSGFAGLDQAGLGGLVAEGFDGEGVGGLFVGSP